MFLTAGYLAQGVLRQFLSRTSSEIYNRLQFRPEAGIVD